MALQLFITREKTGVFFLSVYQADGVTPQSLAGAVIYFHAANPTSFAINKSSPSSGITIQNVAGGTDCATLQIEPGDTASLVLSPGGTVGMPCELTLQVGSEYYELASGVLTVAANVGTP
jgi:hypothetical protein